MVKLQQVSEKTLYVCIPVGLGLHTGRRIKGGRYFTMLYIDRAIGQFLN